MKIIISLILISLPIVNFAQGGKDESLYEKAVVLYEQGKLIEAKEVLYDTKYLRKENINLNEYITSILFEEGDFDRADELKVKELLSSILFEEGDFDKAIFIYKEILDKYPWYTPNRRELFSLSNNFEINRNWSFSLDVPLFLTLVYVSDIYSIQNIEKTRENYGNQGLGYGLGISIGKTVISPNIEVMTGLEYKRFQHFYTGNYNNSSGSEMITYILSLRETHKWISMPLNVKYNFVRQDAKYFKSNKLKPLFYFVGGLNLDFVFIDRFEPFLYYINGFSITEFESFNLRSLGLRRKMNMSYTIAIGGEIPLRQISSYLTHGKIEIGYNALFFDINKKENRYTPSRLLEEYNYVDNDINLGHLYIKLGINLVSYKSKYLGLDH